MTRVEAVTGASRDLFSLFLCFAWFCLYPLFLVTFHLSAFPFVQRVVSYTVDLS